MPLQSKRRLIPAGGTTGQALKKASNANYDATWQTDATGGGGSQPSGKYLSLNGAGFVGAFDISDDTLVEQVNIVGNSFTSINANGATALLRITANENPSMTSADLRNMTAATYIYLNSLSSLATLLLSGSDAIVTFDAAGTAVTNIDLSNRTDLDDVNVGSGPLDTFDVSGSVNVTLMSVSSCNVTALDFSGLTIMTDLDASNNSALASLIIDDSALLTSVDASGCALDQANVDAALAALDGFGLSNGTVDLSGGTNAPPSAAGLISAANLTGKGWTVTTN